jgi:hypothetical protein
MGKIMNEALDPAHSSKVLERFEEVPTGSFVVVAKVGDQPEELGSVRFDDRDPGLFSQGCLRLGQLGGGLGIPETQLPQTEEEAGASPPGLRFPRRSRGRAG